MSSVPAVLVFGASDPTGAAGLSADQLAIASMGCHAASVVTAIDAGDGDSEGLVALDSELIVAQAHTVLQSMAITACKVGAIVHADQVQPIAALLADYDSLAVVLDSWSRHPEDDDAESELAIALREVLLPQATVVAASLAMAQRFVSLVNDDERRRDLPASVCARELIGWGAEFVLLSDAEPGSAQAAVALYDESGLVRSDALPRLETMSTRLLGVGDTLSAALAGLLAQGVDVAQACQEACQYTAAAMVHAFPAAIGTAVPDRLFWAGDDEDDVSGDLN